MSTKTSVTYRFSSSEGLTIDCDCLDEALDHCLALWPDFEHETDSVGRTLIWRNQAESENDPGSNAVAEIIELRSED